MPYVVTQACCADASCVVACPVNCIHPAPGEPGFAEAEMVFVDAAACVDCGACATACPVDAIKPHTTLTPAEEPFVAVNAAYYDCFPHRDRRWPPCRRSAGCVAPDPVRVAVVGAGPAGLYTADELLRHPGTSVDVFDRLAAPHGLVRYGVAPDHPHTRRVQRLFGRIERQPGFRYRLGVEVGRDVTLDELQRAYDAVVYAVGAASDRRLGIAGEDLPGSLAATDLVAWYNGHPEHRDLGIDLAHERAVVVGTGNVALDVARMLTHDPAVLAGHRHRPDALDTLAGSRLREVVSSAAAVASTPRSRCPSCSGSPASWTTEGSTSSSTPAGTRWRATTPGPTSCATSPPRPRPGLRRVVLRFGARPVRLVGPDRVTGVVVERAGRTETVPAGLVVRAIGYHGQPVPGLPHDAATGTVPHRAGRVPPGSTWPGGPSADPAASSAPTSGAPRRRSPRCWTTSTDLGDLDDRAARPATPAPIRFDDHRGRTGSSR